MTDIVERLKFIAIDNAETLTEDEHATLSEAAAILSEADKRVKEARAKAVEDVLSALTAHELYQYRPKAFQGFIEYARREFGSTPVRKPAVDSGGSGDE